MGMRDFLTASLSAATKAGPLPRTLMALPGLELGKVQRTPNRLSVAIAFCELRIVILVSRGSACPSETFIISVKYFFSGYCLETLLKAPPENAVFPCGAWGEHFSIIR